MQKTAPTATAPAPIDFTGKILLFDFDGTIVETETLAQQVIAEYFSQRDFPHAHELSGLIVGRTWQLATENIVRFAREKGHDLPPIEELRREFKARYREKFEKGVRLIPGVKPALEKLKRRSKFMGIVTGSERDEVETLLSSLQLEGYFDRIWAYGDYARSKPDPAPYLQALADLGASPSDTIVFEDSRAGMESAFLAGLPWVQVAHEAHALEPDLRSLCMIRTWDELCVSFPDLG